MSHNEGDLHHVSSTGDKPCVFPQRWHASGAVMEGDIIAKHRWPEVPSGVRSLNPFETLCRMFGLLVPIDIALSESYSSYGIHTRVVVKKLTSSLCSFVYPDAVETGMRCSIWPSRRRWSVFIVAGV